MELDPKVKLTDDATAKVTAEGLLGSKFIALEQGGSDALLADGGIISNTQGAVDIWALISQAMFANKGSGAGSDGAIPPSDTQTP
jgi:phospholipid/cholesterol/gamma-HCH transport system substrate-binding protein